MIYICLPTSQIFFNVYFSFGLGVPLLFQRHLSWTTTRNQSKQHILQDAAPFRTKLGGGEVTPLHETSWRAHPRNEKDKTKEENNTIDTDITRKEDKTKEMTHIVVNNTVTWSRSRPWSCSCVSERGRSL